MQQQSCGLWLGIFPLLYFFNHIFLRVSFFHITFATKNKIKGNMVNYNAHSCIVPAVISNRCGVFIQDIKGKLWNTEDWDSSVEPNAIAVISKEAKFLIALSEPKLGRAVSSSHTDPLENCMTAIASSATALSDHNGAWNTANILKMQPSATYAAGWCNAFVFPDGKTKGYLPSLGQLYLAYQNKAAVDAALIKCGGAVMTENHYWSSTFWGASSNRRYCWLLNWSDGYVGHYFSYRSNHVRPFADF